MSNIKSQISANNVRTLKFTKDQTVDVFNSLDKVGITFDASELSNVASKAGTEGFAMDSLTQGVITAAGGAPIQFLQNFLTGWVQVLTQPLEIDNLVGITTVGSWEDEEVIQGILEYTGKALPYNDLSNVPLSSYNVSYEKRTNVRGEEGLQVGKLEEARMAKMGINTLDDKRSAAMSALSIFRDQVGFFGFNSGANRTYGLLNEPGLEAYQTIADGAGANSIWSSKTYLEICLDIRTAVSRLRNNSKNTVEPEKSNLVLAVAAGSIDYLSTNSDFGNSVMDWIKTTYPSMRVVGSNRLTAANAGDNVFYLYAETVENGGSDNQRVFEQLITAQSRLIGSEITSKMYVEDYTNGTAGVMCKRPFAVVRFTGI